MTTTHSNILLPQARWETLHFYKKCNVLYQMTYCFTRRFLQRGDRTIDQMIQAARSGKQNIVEGSADGVTSTEMEIKLVNVARGSLKELLEDYMDYLSARRLPVWNKQHQRYDSMLAFCREHDEVEDYEKFFEVWSDEEMANVGITLCHLADKMMSSYLKFLEEKFVKEGGIKERMTSTRLGYRNKQKEELERLRHENELLKRRIAELERLGGLG